jgi:hypothetical protein
MAARTKLSARAVMVMILVPIGVCAAILVVAVAVMNLPLRGWAILTAVFCAAWYLAIWLGLRKAGIGIGIHDFSVRERGSSDAILSVGSRVLRLSGGFLIAALGCLLFLRGDNRAWMFLVGGLLILIIRWRSKSSSSGAH